MWNFNGHLNSLGNDKRLFKLIVSNLIWVNIRNFFLFLILILYCITLGALVNILNLRLLNYYFGVSNKVTMISLYKYLIMYFMETKILILDYITMFLDLPYEIVLMAYLNLRL